MPLCCLNVTAVLPVYRRCWLLPMACGSLNVTAVLPVYRRCWLLPTACGSLNITAVLPVYRRCWLLPTACGSLNVTAVLLVYRRCWLLPMACGSLNVTAVVVHPWGGCSGPGARAVPEGSGAAVGAEAGVGGGAGSPPWALVSCCGLDGGVRCWDVTERGLQVGQLRGVARGQLGVVITHSTQHT